VSTTRRSAKFAALAVSLSFVAAACGSDGGSTADTTPATTGAPATTTGSATTEATGTTEVTATTSAPGDGAAMRITYDLSDKAVWDDGSPITIADFQCTLDATMNTPGSLSTTGYDQIISITAGDSDKQVVIDWSSTYAPWKGVFNGLLKADQFDDCNDVSTAFDDGFNFSAREWKIDSWSNEQLVYVPNPGYTGTKTPTAKKIVIVPAEDGPTLLKSGTVDFIFPQAYTGIDQELADPNVKFSAANGGSFEGVYFQQATGPFSDPDYRAAFAKSFDRDALYKQIYEPFAQGTPLLDCGPIAPGPYCDDVFKDTYDPEGAKTILTDAGWTMGADGFWVNPDGEVPDVRWMINTGNTRRESTQEFMIPLLAAAGFKVHADNCEALPCVFETRLPSLDYDLGMYINTVAPDPSYLRTWGCDQVPSEENEFKGQNQQGWCNQEATDLLIKADSTVDEAERTATVKQVLQMMADDYVMLPTLQFPNVGAYRTDRTGNTNAELANYRAINDWYQWDDVDGDGTIVLGAEQFPTADCKNPITECSNSSWYVWMVSFALLPGVYDTTADQGYELGEMMASDPVVEVL
jgi:peptide/nickel transport system substrate-binding protein